MFRFFRKMGEEYDCPPCDAAAGFFERNIRSIIYGALDGIVTTFAIIASAAGASLGATAIIILGLANLIADGFSMGASSYMATKSEQDVEHKNGNGHDIDPAEPRMNGLVTFGAFVVAGSIPLVPFLIPHLASHAFVVSAIATTVAFFLVGGTRSFVTHRSFAACGFEMLIVGGCAALIAFGIGAGVDRLLS